MTTVALTIAGSDPSGGAGLQADLKTFHQHGVYGTSVVTLLTVQNTTGVRRVEVMPADLVAEQLAAVLEDVPPAAAKTGALGNRAVIDAVADVLEGIDFPLVVDPVMVSEHGAPLLSPGASEVLRKRLIPRATLVTPNAHEAQWLCGVEVNDRRSAAEAARRLAQLGPRAVLVKGGHVPGEEAIDVLLIDGDLHELRAPRVDTRHTHGTGCTYAAAIVSHLARGEPLVRAVAQSKRWLTDALRHPPQVGGGVGPVDHFTSVRRE